MKEQFSFTGRVIEGHHLGHTLGFPTANIVVTPGEKVPTLGVYAAWVTLPDGSRHAAVTNLGVRPTVETAGALSSKPPDENRPCTGSAKSFLDKHPASAIK